MRLATIVIFTLVFLSDKIVFLMWEFTNKWIQYFINNVQAAKCFISLSKYSCYFSFDLLISVSQRVAGASQRKDSFWLVFEIFHDSKF